MTAPTYHITILLDGEPHEVSVVYGPNRPDHATIIAAQQLAERMVEDGRFPNADEAIRNMEFPTPPVMV